MNIYTSEKNTVETKMMASTCDFQQDYALTFGGESYFTEINFDSTAELQLQHDQNFEKIKLEKYSFVKEKEKLMGDPNYSGKFVAVIDGTVVDSDPNEITLSKRVYTTYGYIPILIQKIADERIAKVYSPRIRK